MPHNGGIFQTGFNFLQIGQDYPFLNFIKTAQTFGLNSSKADPSNLDANNYIINTPGTDEFGTVFFIPIGADRVGNYVIKWDGGGPTTTFNIGFLGSLTSAVGTNTGANGRFTISTNPGSEPYDIGRVVFRYKNPTPNPIVTNIRFVHADDEALLDSGQVFSPLFKLLIRQCGFGVLRNLDWNFSNTSSLAKWEHRVPVDAISYAGEHCPQSLWAGEAVKTGTTYAVAKPGFVLVHGAQVIVRWGSNGTLNGGFTFADTLNVQSTGDVPIRSSYGGSATFDDALNMDAGWYSILMYDADLGCWLMAGGSSASGDKMISAQVPFELFVRLCVEVGAHPWFVQPFWSSDPVSNLMPSLAAYVDAFIQDPANGASWMIPRYELVSNENWNYSGGFSGTRYSWAKAQARWGVSNDEHNYHGRAFALNGKAIWDALGVSSKQPNRFHLICGVQTYGSTTNSATRLSSALHVADNPGVNRPASDFATHVACATYFGIAMTMAARTQELVLAMQYDAATTDGQRDALATQFVQLMYDAQPTIQAIYKSWRDFAAVYGCALTGYEGGYSPDYASGSKLSGNVTAITRGATTRVFSTDRLPTVGMQVSYTNIGGTTGLNGNTYTVLSVDATSYYINVDSTGMGAFISGGDGAGYLGTLKPVNNLRFRGKQVDEVKKVARANIEGFIRAGGSWYPKFMFSGDSFNIATGGSGQVWAGFFPGVYGTRCKEMEVHAEMHAAPNSVLNFRIRV